MSRRCRLMRRHAFVIGWFLSALGCGGEPSGIPKRNYTAADHDQLYQQGTDLIKPYMTLHGAPSKPVRTSASRTDLNRGIQLLSEVIKINPGNWPAYWTTGKAYQALDEHELACEAFGHAFDLQNENPDVAREYMLECLE